MSETTTFFFYFVLGSIVGASIVYCLVLWRLRRQLRFTPRKKSYLTKKEIRVEVQEDHIQRSSNVVNQFIKDNLQLILHREDYARAKDRALVMKDSDEVRRISEE